MKQLARWIVAPSLLAAALLLAPRPAEARILDLHVGGRVGGLTGWGTNNATTPDFFEHTRGFGVGFEAGLKLLVVDLSLTFTQVADGGGTVGTLTQFLLGTSFDIPAGSLRFENGQPRSFVRPAIQGGFGFGTAGPVDPPLDNKQVSDKGFVSYATVAYEFFLNPFIGVGAQGQFGWHYFLGGQVANDSKAHSTGYHLAGYATLTFHLGY
jgi:hypothetical protein